MYEHERADAPLCDQPRRDHRLAKGRRGGQNACLVRQHRVCRRLLIGSELALKAHLERAAAVALVANGRANAQVCQRLANIVEAPARQSDVMRVILGARGRIAGLTGLPALESTWVYIRATAEQRSKESDLGLGRRCPIDEARA